MEANGNVCLRWNNHQSTVLSVFETLLDSGTLVDCTIAAEGRCLKAHRVILSSCSPFFALLFSQHYEKHPIVVLKDIRFQELRAVVDYMYCGEVNISKDRLGGLLQAAKLLQIKGLSDCGESRVDGKVEVDKTKEMCSSVLQSGTAVEQSAEPATVTQFPPDTEVVDLSDDSLPSPDAQETLSTKEKNTSPIDCALRASHSLSAHHENKIGNSSSATENHLSTLNGTSNEPQVSSMISAHALTPLTSAAFPKSVLENNLPDVPENKTDRIKRENTLLPKAASEQTAITLKCPLQKPGALTETPVKSESELMDTDDNFADDVSRNFTFNDVDCAVHREQQSPSDRANFLSEGMSIESVVDWTCDIYSGLPQSKRPCFSRCRVCGKVYKYNRNLTKHLKYECGKEPQFCCPYCPARYTQNGTLRKHLEKHHQSSESVK
ncbi:longitudinals lacking protein, isoforms A/B/D/L-like [Schistocerca gregaria]|uniref:longitudinals lacking protein, isoforms A/B/D/L-like n=1 Tax=Schistocerca gregaria TaxID=7010 RepID=UPI00211F21D1|nr:longitudinals lacking protein, isoforms A/B/D/L-like [Schistocerca gregaria]XP_049841132.1 longitudinals lacking protein, isoforms A/B/D/L-like [Schistocerca gregaria]